MTNHPIPPSTNPYERFNIGDLVYCDYHRKNCRIRNIGYDWLSNSREYFVLGFGGRWHHFDDARPNVETLEEDKNYSFVGTR